MMYDADCLELLYLLGLSTRKSLNVYIYGEKLVRV